MQAPYLTCHNLAAAYDSRTLFKNLSLSIHPGERWGIVGPNGAGKSTLFKIIKGLLTPLEGSVSLKNNVRTAFIDQKINFSNTLTVEEIIRANLPLEFDTDKQIDELEAQINAHTALVEENLALLEDKKWVSKLTLLNEKIAEVNGAPTENIIQSALKLGYLNDISSRLFSELSGGQQKRVQIIASLLTNPNLILLDEPTNHLDIQTVEWLEEFLLKIAEEGFSSFGLNANHEEVEPVAFIIVSHDRALLDTLVNKIFEIEHGVAKKYDGNYEEYNEQKIQFLLTEERIRSKMANTMRRELSWLRDGVRARTTKQTARIKRAHDLDKKLQIKNQNANLKKASELSFSATMVTEQRDQDDGMITKQLNLGQQELVKCKQVSILHPASSDANRLIFKDLNLIIKPGSRLALLGPNGCGKSTLLRYIAQRIEPYSGVIKYHDLCSMSYFDQKRDTLDYTETVRNNIQSSGDQVFFGGKHIHVMSYLDRFMFAKEDVNRTVANLSGGEQARLLLAQLMLDQGNLLILDEPTNDLDIPTLQVLEKNLADFDGAVLFTSHDRYFMQKVATSILTFLGETKGISDWMMFPDLNQALDHLETLAEVSKETNQSSNTHSKNKNKQKNNKLASAEKNHREMDSPRPYSASKHAKEIANLEERIETIEALIVNLNADLEALYTAQKPFTETQPIVEKIDGLKIELRQCYQKLENLI